MKSYLAGQRILLDVNRLDELPENARHYLERVSQLTGIPLSIFSVGPDRNANKCVRSPWRHDLISYARRTLLNSFYSIEGDFSF